jgi:hypothetical protein
MTAEMPPAVAKKMAPLRHQAMRGPSSGDREMANEYARDQPIQITG